MKSNNVEKKKIIIGTLNGSTGMGMVKLMEDSNLGKSELDYKFIIPASPDELLRKIMNNEVDIAAVPTNMASILYNKTNGEVQFTVTNTLSVLYILEKGSNVNSISDLKGKTIGLSGKGASPDFVLKYLLKENNLKEDDITIDYNLDHESTVEEMLDGSLDLGLIPQPHVTTAIMKNKDLRIAVDINKEWKKKNKDIDLAMGVLVNQKGFGDRNPEVMKIFLEEYKKSIEFTNNRLKESSKLIEKYSILPNKIIAEKAIPSSNIVFINAEKSKKSIDKLLKIYYDFDPKSIGGKLPNDDFYYKY